MPAWPWLLNSVPLRLIFVGSENITGFMSLFGICNFEVAPKYLKNLCTRGLRVFGNGVLRRVFEFWKWETIVEIKIIRHELRRFYISPTLRR